MTVAAGAGVNGLYVQHYGWFNWVASTDSTDISKAARAGTSGKALRMEALELEIVKVS